MATRVLRSKSKITTLDPKASDRTVDSIVLAPEPIQAKRGRKRRRLVKEQYVEPKIFNPKFFTKGNGYENICDSSDSESEYEFVPIVEEESQFEAGSDEMSESINVQSEDIEGSIEGSIEQTEDSIEEVENSIELNSQDEEDGYFTLDNGPLSQLLIQKIKSKFPDISNDAIEESIKTALSGAREDLTDEYSGAQPKDTAWKLYVSETELPALEQELKKLRQNINDKLPTIPKILRSGLTEVQKERALQLYDALNNIEPYTLPYMEMAIRISEIINTGPKESDPETTARLNILESKMKDETVSMEKIVNARVIQADKIRAMQLYNAMLQHPTYGEEWFATQRAIRRILESSLPSDEEVARIEASEAEIRRSTLSFTTDLKSKIFELDADPDVKSKLYELYTDMISRGASDSQYPDMRNKLLWMLKLPHRKMSIVKTPETREEIRKVCLQTYKSLEDNIYGMGHVKTRVVQAINNRMYNPKSRALLALKGKPGVGKTRVAKLIAKASGRPFERINLGGAVDSTIFKGADNVWIGSSPSVLLQLIARSKASDAVILLDEIDKLGSSDKGIELQHSLLHILDPMQNKEFQDAFLKEFNHDISNIWFIPAMNDETKLTRELRDRLDIIEIESYSHDDMIKITKQFTLPETLESHGISKDDITISTGGIRRLLSRLGDDVKDSGMRPLEKAIIDIVSRLNLLRTLYTEDGFDIGIPIDFKLDDFHGFPYEITEHSIDVLHVIPKKPPVPSYFI